MANMGDDQVRIEAEPGKGYALSGKIMLTAIVILFAVVVFMVGLHLYARWYLVRLRRRQLERRRGRAVGRRVSRTQILMYVDNRNPGADRGLELPVLNSLPVFLFPAVKADEPPMECAVCLSEFIKGDIVRMLPKCSHTFHLECIDMWFHSHSTCPNCRSAVELAPDTIFAAGKPLSFMAKKPTGPDPGSSSGSGLCSTCQHEGSRDSNSTSSESDRRRKGLDLGRIEVPPRRNESESELTQSSPAGRFLSRILSMGRKSPTTAGTSRELNFESPLGESTQGQAPSLELGSMEPPPRNESENELCQGSPAGRFLSRILSMGRKSPFPSPTTPCGAGTSRELDLESGPSESTRGQASS